MPEPRSGTGDAIPRCLQRFVSPRLHTLLDQKLQCSLTTLSAIIASSHSKSVHESTTMSCRGCAPRRSKTRCADTACMDFVAVQTHPKPSRKRGARPLHEVTPGWRNAVFGQETAEKQDATCQRVCRLFCNILFINNLRYGQKLLCTEQFLLTFLI